MAEVPLAVSRGRFVVIALVGVGLVAGCASMPTSGPVIPGSQIEGEEPAVYVPPDPPTDGEDQLGIVDGFIDAMGSYEPNYEVARMFLTEEASAAWDPTAGVSVYEGAKPPMTVVDESTVQLTPTVTGTLGADGAFAPTTEGSARTLDVELQQVDGEWRISNPPPGLLISDFNFRREFRPYNLYFFDPTYSVLVPDPVYVPRNTRAPATVLARTLLDGPTDWLAPAVESAFPEDAALGIDSVPVDVDSGTARVELGPEARSTSPEVREQMAAQIAWTLAGVDGVQDVEITAGDTPLTSGDEPSVSVADYSEYDPAVTSSELPVYAVTGDGVVRISGADVVPLPGLLGDSTDVREIAVDTDGDTAVVVNGAGSTLSSVSVGDNDAAAQLLTGADLWSPVLDRNGTVWALGLVASGQRMPLAYLDGAEVAVSVADLGDRSVNRLEPSSDGTRVVLVIGAQAYVGLIIRDVDASSRVQLTNLRRLPVDGDVIDVAWRSAGSVGVLVEQDTGSGIENQIWEVSLDGTPPVSRGSVPGAVALEGVPRNPLVVSTADGVLFRQDSGVRWVDIGNGFSAPAYPQG